MIRTIKQRLYVFGLLPLGLLAVSIVAFNGWSRIEDAKRELTTAREATAALLQGPASDALVVGNAVQFDQAVKAVMRTSPALICVNLDDAEQRTVVRSGRCDNDNHEMQYFGIHEPTNGLSDFEEKSNGGRVVGQLGLLMRDPTFARKRQAILLQLGLSLMLTAIVLAVTGRLLRVRLLAPIGRIGEAMHALSQRDYNVRVPASGNDELTRLGEAINSTIATVAEYTRELERRRSEADQALQDADAANLVRDGLVRSLTEDLSEPMSSMHSQLTAIAINNPDPQLRERIKNVMALLQDAQSDFADLIEIATHMDRTRTAPWADATQMWEDIERDIKRLSDTEALTINFAVTHMGPTADSAVTPPGVLLNIDGVRLKKAILYLCRALGRRGQESGVHVNAELIRFSAERLHVSVHIVALGGATTHGAATPWMKAIGSNGNGVPAALGLRDRESKIIDYLLRAIGATITVGASSAAAVNVLLDVTCAYSMERARTPIATDWIFSAPPISATLVSNDLSFARYSTRADLSNHELKFVTFEQALTSPAEMHGSDTLLIDISDDIADVLALLDAMKELGTSLSPLVAICPPGIVSDSLANRLFELGFVGMVQKPLQYSRLIEVIRESLAQPLADVGNRGKLSRPDDSL